MDLIGEFERANDSIGRNGFKEPDIETVEVLAQCQEKAFVLGSFFEAGGEKTTHPVGILEDYCENIYQMSLSLADDNRCRKLSKIIRKQLAKLRQDISYGMPYERKEIVFLPYKVSMWDSLETIWEAAWDDESCDAYVIPLPYYDKNPDGSLGQVHYEGDEYPDYVPVVSWEEYSFEERRPDITFIHNPYDAWNVVTTIHPDFYSEKIKRCTDLLVYVRYFVAAGNRVDRNKAVC